MSLEKGANSSYTHREDGLHIPASPSSRVTQVRDAIEGVFQVAIIKNQVTRSPVFFRPEKIIDSPFENMFVPANLGLSKFSTGDFIPADIGGNDESHVCKARQHIGNKGYNSYLLGRP